MIIFHCCFLSVLLQWMYFQKLKALMFEITPWNLFQKTYLCLLHYKTEIAVRREYLMYQYFLNVRKDKSLFEGKTEGFIFQVTHPRFVVGNYKYKPYIVKHNDFIKVYFLHCFVQRHFSPLVMNHLQVDYFS